MKFGVCEYITNLSSQPLCHIHICSYKQQSLSSNQYVWCVVYFLSLISKAFCSVLKLVNVTTFSKRFCVEYKLKKNNGLLPTYAFTLLLLPGLHHFMVTKRIRQSLRLYVICVTQLIASKRQMCDWWKIQVNNCQFIEFMWRIPTKPTVN